MSVGRPKIIAYLWKHFSFAKLKQYRAIATR